MQTQLFKFILFAVCVVFPINLLGQEIETRQEKPLSYWDIRKILIFRSPQRESDAEINERLIKTVSERKVYFLISKDEEVALKKEGASDLLIKTIRENLPPAVGEPMILYKKFTDNYNGNATQRKTAVEAAREFVQKYSDYKDSKDAEAVKYAVEYLKGWLNENDPYIQAKILLYKKFTDNYAGNIEQQKTALEAAKEYIKKYSDDGDSKELIEYFKGIIKYLENHIKENEPCRYG